MRSAIGSTRRRVPVCSGGGWQQAYSSAGGAQRRQRAEGKIKETGTTSGRFLKLLLSAHWLGRLLAAPHFFGRSAAYCLNTLSLLDFQRHRSPKSGISGCFWSEAYP